MKSTATHEEIEAAGQEIMGAICGGKPTESLGRLRYRKYVEKTSRGTRAVEGKNLPPTPSSTKLHSFRVYLQTQQWLGVHMDPLNWGWKNSNGVLWPIHNDMPPGPNHLMRVIRCTCTSGCSRSRCSCRKYDMTCSFACMCGSTCSNHRMEESPADWELLERWC